MIRRHQVCKKNLNTCFRFVDYFLLSELLWRVAYDIHDYPFLLLHFLAPLAVYLKGHM